MWRCPRCGKKELEFAGIMGTVCGVVRSNRCFPYVNEVVCEGCGLRGLVHIRAKNIRWSFIKHYRMKDLKWWCRGCQQVLPLSFFTVDINEKVFDWHLCDICIASGVEARSVSH
jgi:hypothetical protein